MSECVQLAQYIPAFGKMIKLDSHPRADPIGSFFPVRDRRTGSSAIACESRTI